MQAYWDAANYLVVGQIYLQDNPLLREPLQPAHIKPRLLGHWGTSPGLNFIYGMSRFHLCKEALRRARRSVANAEDLIRRCDAQLARHHDYVRQNLDDIPEIRDWVWTD